MLIDLWQRRIMGDADWNRFDPEPSAALPAPRASEFPAYPCSWYLFARSANIRRDRPFARDIFGRRLVAYRASQGETTVMQSRCSHMGADLSLGSVRDDTLQCPFHHWRFGTDGRCTHIPVTDKIPYWARQITYPVVERHGFIFLFNGEEPTFPLPFFFDCRPEDFSSAAAFETTLRCPWYLVGANAFDLQHFKAAHDRRLIGVPEVDCPAPFARRATGTFGVCSNSLQDRITRAFAGSQVTMSITDWCGNLLFATARFRKTCSYGMVATEPLADGSVKVTVIVFVPRSHSSLARAVFDPLHAAVRRMFIKAFLSEDARRLNGTPYQPQGMIAEDRYLAEYFTWLAQVARGVPHVSDEGSRSLRPAEHSSSLKERP